MFCFLLWVFFVNVSYFTLIEGTFTLSKRLLLYYLLPDKDGKVVLSRHEKAGKELQSMIKISTLSSPVSPNAALPSSSTVPLYISNHALKAEIMLAMKCVVSHYSHRSMDEFPDLFRYCKRSTIRKDKSCLCDQLWVEEILVNQPFHNLL